MDVAGIANSLLGQCFPLALCAKRIRPPRTIVVQAWKAALAQALRMYNHYKVFEPPRNMTNFSFMAGASLIGRKLSTGISTK